MDWFFYAFDNLWSGKTQLPASLLLKLSNHIPQSLQLAKYRFYVALCVFLQILGAFFITIGLFSWQPIGLLITGITLKVLGVKLKLS